MTILSTVLTTVLFFQDKKVSISYTRLKSKLNGVGTFWLGTVFEVFLGMKRLACCFILMICPQTFARVDVRTTKPMVIPLDNVSSKITSKDVEQIIPTDVNKNDSTGSVMGRIMDRGLNYWYNNSGFKESSVGRVAEQTQEKLKTDVVVKGANPKSVSHKFSFRVEAFQALAKMEYTGWMRADVNYNAQKSQTNIAVREKIYKDKDLVVSHSLGPKEGVSSMGVGWSF